MLDTDCHPSWAPCKATAWFQQCCIPESGLCALTCTSQALLSHEKPGLCLDFASTDHLYCCWFFAYYGFIDHSKASLPSFTGRLSMQTNFTRSKGMCQSAGKSSNEEEFDGETETSLMFTASPMRSASGENIQCQSMCYLSSFVLGIKPSCTAFLMIKQNFRNSIKARWFDHGNYWCCLNTRIS